MFIEINRNNMTWCKLTIMKKNERINCFSCYTNQPDLVLTQTNTVSRQPMFLTTSWIFETALTLSNKNQRMQSPCCLLVTDYYYWSSVSLKLRTYYLSGGSGLFFCFCTVQYNTIPMSFFALSFVSQCEVWNWKRFRLKLIQIVWKDPTDNGAAHPIVMQM